MRHLWLVIALLAALPARADEFHIVTAILPPWVEERDGRTVGLAVELVQGLANVARRQITIEVLPWAQAQKAASEASHVGIFPLVRTPAREESYRWLVPVAVNRFVALAMASSPLASVDDCKDQVVGVYAASLGAIFAQEHDFQRIVQVREEELSARNLLSGRIGCWLVGELTAQEMLRREGSSLAQVKVLGAVSDGMLWLAASRQVSEAEAQLWQDAMDTIKADGSYDQIVSKYQN